MTHESRQATRVDKWVGKRLRSRRQEVSMSQEELADLLGISFQQVQKYESGANRIAASRLFDIAAALNAPMEYFFEGLASRVRGKTSMTKPGASAHARKRAQRP